MRSRKIPTPAETFDEPWKLGQEGEVGAQWGLWDKDEHLKYGTDAAPAGIERQ